MTFLVRVFDIAQRGIGSIVRSMLETGVHGPLHLAADVLCVPFVDDVNEWSKVVVLLVCAVYAVVHGDIADAVQWEIHLHVLASQ